MNLQLFERTESNMFVLKFEFHYSVEMVTKLLLKKEKEATIRLDPDLIFTPLGR